MEEEIPCPPERHPCLAGTVVDSLENIIYVSDPDTYDVLWLNPSGLCKFGIEDFRGHKCHKLFQGLDSPCPFCPIGQLSFDSFYVWEHANPVMGRHFLIKDKLIYWKGRTLHLEVAVDITTQAEQRKSAQRKFEIERTVVKCVRTLSQGEQLSPAIDKVLALVGGQYEADRAYIFEFGRSPAGDSIINNSHEWCAPGIKSQKGTLQNLPFDVVRPWIELFNERKDIIIEELEDIRASHQDLYALLKRQDIRRLFAVPLYAAENVLTGFVGVDNPRMDMHDFTLLHSLTYFMDNEMAKRRMAEELRSLGLRDGLTGLGNRNAYLTACNQIKTCGVENLGVIFVDLNALKYVNDHFGHGRGDEYIRSLSELFLSFFRSRDIFRIGGDEFVFLCENMPEDLFHTKIKALLRKGDDAFPGSISLGAVWSPLAMDVESLVREADMLMYAEKQRQKEEREASGAPHPFAGWEMQGWQASSPRCPKSSDARFCMKPE